MSRIDWGLAIAIVAGCALVVMLSGCTWSHSFCTQIGKHDAEIRCSDPDAADDSGVQRN